MSDKKEETYFEKFEELYNELCAEAHTEMIKALMDQVDDCETYQLIYDLADASSQDRIYSIDPLEFGKRFVAPNGYRHQ